MRNTLTFRLLVASSLWMVVTLVIVGILLSLLFRSYLEQRFDAFLVDQLQGNIAASEIAHETGALHMTWSPSNLRFHRPLSGWYWEILENGTPVATSRSLWRHHLDVTDPGPGTGLQYEERLGPAGTLLRVVRENVTFPGSDAQFTFVVAGPISDIDQDVQEFSTMLIISLAVLGTGLVGAVFVQIRYGLGPLRRLQHALMEVRSGQSERLPEKVPTEIQPVVTELNGLLDHNAALLERARTQTANMAHALKNPLMVLTNEAREINSEKGRLMSEQLMNITKSVNRYLSKARVAGAGRFRGTRTNVREVAEDLRFTLDRLYKEKDLRITLQNLEECYFPGEGQDLEEMLGNLMDNACKWAKKSVEVYGERIGENVRIIVEDDGPGIPEGQESLALDRGRRLDEATQGSGLGLDIVRDIALLYNGTLHLSPSGGGGVRAALVWPVSA